MAKGKSRREAEEREGAGLNLAVIPLVGAGIAILAPAAVAIRAAAKRREQGPSRSRLAAILSFVGIGLAAIAGAVAWRRRDEVKATVDDMLESAGETVGHISSDLRDRATGTGTWSLPDASEPVPA
jgi:hypothetical protein